MTTVEKLFLQIFERKDWIIEQVQRQADAYTEQLASRLLIDGITPPPCLLNPRFNSRSSEPHELKKEEIISKLLLQHPQDSIRYSTGGCSLYDRPVVARGNEQLPNEMFMETNAPNKGVNVINEPSVALACPNDDIGCSLTRVTEQDNSANSPQNETDARLSSIYAAPDTSLARIQRSKSRQKARELRTSVKAAAKSCLSKEDRTRSSFTGDTISKIDFLQVAQDKWPSEAGKRNDISGENSVAEEGKDDKGNGRSRDSGRLARSSASDGKHTFLNDHSKTNDKEKLDGGILVQPTSNSSQQSDGVMEGVNLAGADISLESYGAKNSVLGKTHDTKRQNRPYSGRTTRSRGSSQQTDGLNKSLGLGTSAACNPKEGTDALSYSIGDLKHGVDASNKLLDAVKNSQACSDRFGETHAICNSKDIKKPVISSNIAASRVTRSRSLATEECPLGSNHQENAEIGVGNGPIEPVAVQPVSCGKRLDPVITCTESYGLALKQSSDCCMLVKPKQLNFDETDGCDSNKISGGLLSKKRKLDGLFGPSMDSASLKYHKSSGTFFEQELPMENVASSQSGAATTHSLDVFDDEETMDMNEKLVVEDVLLSKGQVRNPSMDHKTRTTSFEPQLVMGNVVSSQSKSAKTHSHEDTNVEMMNIGLDMNENLVVEDVLLSKKRDGLFGQECNPSMDSASSIDHKTTSTFFEQQSLMENVVSSQSKAARRHSCTKDETMDIGLDMNENPVMKDVEHNLEVSLHDDLAVVCEVDCQDKVEENAGGVFIPVFKHPKPSFTSCLTKQGDNGTENWSDNEVGTSDQDFGSSKSKKMEVGKKSKLKLDSAKVNTWPRDPQRNIEDQRNCFSDSQGCRVHIQRNALRCDLLASENDLHLSQSDDDIIQRVDGETMSALSHGIESLHELQPAEATAPVVYGDTLEQSEPSLIKSAAEDRSNNDDVAVTVVDYSDELMPVYEGFTIDEELENAQDFDTLEMPSTTIERAGILEQICKSPFKHHQVQDLYKFMPVYGLVEDVDLGISVDFKKNISESDSDYTFSKQQTFDSVQFSGTPYYWQSKSYYSSPVGKLWDRSASSSGSSANRLSSNPELTCFPIEEDPKESENDEPQENTAANEEKIPVTVSTEMEIVTTENDDEVAPEIKEGVEANHVAEIEPLSGPMKYRDRCSSNSVNIQVNAPRTYDKVKYQSKFHPGIRSNKYEGENRTPSISTRASIRRNASLQTQNSKNMTSGTKRPPLNEAKRNNIVSNIMSFVPIVQQKQAAAVCPVKRDTIKVKALEAAEAAKRREQEKENERKMKKEALKIERARIEKENAVEMELNKKKKQEEMKRKEADVAARKKQREEDERRQMAKKRKIAEARKEQKAQHEKSRGGKNIVIVGNKKGPESLRQNKNADENGSQRNEKCLADVVQQLTSVPEKETNMLEKSPGHLGSTSQETSYDISPYQCSDDEDEDEDEDELRTKKFIPTWASKRAVAMVLPLQQELHPETIFPVGTFCNMDEVLLPRRLQAQ